MHALDKDSDNPASRGPVIRARFRARAGLKRPEGGSRGGTHHPKRSDAADIEGERPIPLLDLFGSHYATVNLAGPAFARFG